MLVLPKQTYAEIRRHGEETYPLECCGALLGIVLPAPSYDDSQGNTATADGQPVKTVRLAIRADNTRTDSAHNRYQIATVDLVRIERQARQRGLGIVGFYHSHPDHPAQWSATDLEEAHWLGCSYVITSVEQGKATVTNSFHLAGTGEEDKRFVGERIDAHPDSDQAQLLPLRV